VRAPTLLAVLLGLAVLGIAFAALERLAGRRAQPPWWRRPGTGTDLAWWFATPLVARTASGIAVALVLAAFVLATGGSIAGARAELAAGRFPDVSPFGIGGVVRAWPLGAQLLAGLFVADLSGYATHRLFHRRPLWAFHAVHHSSVRLDWLSSVRLHPVNDVVARALQAVPVLLLGFDPVVFAAVAPFATLYALLLHANVRWTFGPLRHVIASPMFHRWHHAADAEGRDRNFAGVFAFLDVAFGTYHLPAGEPKALGVAGDPVPPGFLGQWLHPFRRTRSSAPSASGAVPA
jgi:sterol desaturase/sphingolipid hydroxylase (fatty acid hydroxylase superfamily)